MSNFLKNNAMVKQLLFFLKKNYLFILIFVFLGSFLIHNFDSIGQDIGRHLKIGETIWQAKEVPKTNLFSFTEPDFPFINHHWLSEVIFFGIFSYTGFTGLILVKTFFVLLAFWLLFITIKSHAKFWPIAISFLLSMFIFIQRTEVRPEIFSFVILAFFLFALFKAKLEKNYFYLWFLPVLELFWVNLHIYFFIGPLIFLSFLIDRIIDKKINPKSETLNPKQYQNPNTQNSKRFRTFGFRIWNLFRISNLEFRIFILVILATFVNPAGIHGALLPFNILKEYGYSIVENQTLSFLADFMSFNLSVFAFKFSVAVLAFSLILTAKKSRQRIFEIIVLAFFVYAGFRMLRNLPLYALASFPVLAIALTDIQDYFLRFNLNKIKAFHRVGGFVKILLSALIILLIFLVANNSYYKYMSSSRISGFSVPNGLERAVDFVKQNKIEGPMFNNFDIGGYLIWQIEGVRYPDEKVPDPFRVFVDNRPEAYSVKFFNEIYKPMQENKEKWLEFSEKYRINFIFFGHTDTTPWGQNFLENIAKNQGWKIVYINEDAMILVKNNNKNAGIISEFSITEKNAIAKISDATRNSNTNKAGLNLILSRVLFKIGWLEPSAYFADEVIKVDPKNPYPYLHKGLVHVYYSDKQNQQLAAENIKKAIDLGLKEGQYYFILGVVYMNLGRLESAQASFKEAIRLDKNNTQAKEFLNKYFKN